MYLTVEASGTQQCFVQNVHAVGCGKNNNTAVGTETVHFCQQLVQCVFAFIIATHGGSFGACTSYGVNFINEYDARRFLFGLAEQIADA